MAHTDPDGPDHVDSVITPIYRVGQFAFDLCRQFRELRGLAGHWRFKMLTFIPLGRAKEGLSNALLVGARRPGGLTRVWRRLSLLAMILTSGVNMTWGGLVDRTGGLIVMMGVCNNV